MLNVVVVAGKVVELPILKEAASGNKYASLHLKVDRPFRNSNGIYEQDDMSITLWKGIAQTVCDVCSVGDVVSIKGRLQSRQYDGKDGQQYFAYDIIAEFVSFLNKETN